MAEKLCEVNVRSRRRQPSSALALAATIFVPSAFSRKTVTSPRLAILHPAAGDEPSCDEGLVQPQDMPVRVDGKASRITSSPMLGEHTDHVLSDWLGLSAQAVAEMKREGVI